MKVIICTVALGGLLVWSTASITPVAAQLPGLPVIGAQGDVAGAASPPIVPVKCIVILGKSVCVEDRDHDKKNKGDKEKGTNAQERACPPGYVVLDKPNKYGAMCEPKEGFPNSAPQQAEKCKFPGQTGTPPNCQCPADTQFYGYKGCMKTCCGTPSADPKYSKIYMQCHKETATAQKLAVALAKANGDAGKNVTCEITRNYPSN